MGGATRTRAVVDKAGAAQILMGTAPRPCHVMVGGCFAGLNREPLSDLDQAQAHPEVVGLLTHRSDTIHQGRSELLPSSSRKPPCPPHNGREDASCFAKAKLLSLGSRKAQISKLGVTSEPLHNGGTRDPSAWAPRQDFLGADQPVFQFGRPGISLLSRTLPQD